MTFHQTVKEKIERMHVKFSQQVEFPLEMSIRSTRPCDEMNALVSLITLTMKSVLFHRLCATFEISMYTILTLSF